MLTGTNAVDAAAAFKAKSQAIEAFVMHHVTDSDVLALPFLKVKLPWFLHLHGVMVLLSAALLIALLAAAARRRGAVPTGAANLVEAFVLFVRDHMVVPYLGEEDGRRMTPYFCSLFSMILMMNLVGLVPAFAAATADVSVTASLALITLSFMIFGSIYRNGVGGFVKTFVPHGVPFPVLILLVPIEFISLFIKSFALTIRLFANLLAGHLVIFFVLGLIVIFGAAGMPFLLLAVMIYFLEIFVAFLQAYIFTLLSAIFIGQQYYPEH